MDITNLILDSFEVFTRIYAVICRRPYVAVEVQYAPQRDRAGEVTAELIAFTITNVSGPEIEIHRAWFLTSFNRSISSKLLDSKMPVKVRGKDRATYFIPVEEFKAALNKSVGETITKAVVLSKTDSQHVGRVDKVTQEEFAK